MSKDELKSAITEKEKAVQKEKQPAVEGAKPDDLVNEEEVDVKVGKIEERLAKSTLGDSYKEKIRDSLNKLMDKRKKEIEKVDAKAEADFKKLFDDTLKDLENFDGQEEVRVIYETLEPFFENKDKVVDIINFVSYKRGSGRWQKINKRFSNEVHIDQDQISAVQKILGVEVDGKVGPETMNALARMLNENSINVKFAKETQRSGEEKTEEEKDKDEENPPSAEPKVAPEVTNVAGGGEAAGGGESGAVVADGGAAGAAGGEAAQAAGQAGGEAQPGGPAPVAEAPVVADASVDTPTAVEERAQMSLPSEDRQAPVVTISPEVLTSLEAENVKLNQLEDELNHESKYYLQHLMSNGRSAAGHEGDREAYRNAFVNLVNGMENIVDIRNAFVNGDPSRAIAFNDAMIKRSVKVMLLQVDANKHGGLKAVEGEMAIPDSIAEYNYVKARLADNFLQERRGDYMVTGDPLYKAAFDESQQQMTGALKEDVNAGIQQAGSADGNIEGSTVDLGLRQSLESEVSGEANKIIDEFDALQRLQADNPMEAYSTGVSFHEKMKAFKAEKTGDHKIDFATLRKLPNLRQAFFKVVDKFDEQATYVVVQAVVQNKEVVKYRQDFNAFNSRVGHLVRCINKVFEDLRKGKDEPSELVMRSIHEDARDVLGGPLLKNLMSSKVREFAALKYFQGEDDFERKVNMGLSDVKDTFEGVRGRGSDNDHVGSEDFIRAVVSMCHQVQNIEGSAATLETFLKNTGKELAIVTAAVAGAVAMGALVVATGGIAGGGLLVAAGNLGITAVAGGLGAAIGSQYTRAALEGNFDSITTESMFKAWGTGAAYTALGMGTGMIFGTALGRGAAAVAGRSSGTMARAAVYAEQYGAKMTQQAVRVSQVENSGLRAFAKHYFRTVASETREEFVENALEKIGQGVAPDHPWLGFTLSMIPSSTHHAKAAFVKGVNVRMTGHNLALTYSDKGAAKALMISNGVPSQAIVQFDQTGVIDTKVGDLKVEVKPEAPAEAKSESPTEVVSILVLEAPKVEGRSFKDWFAERVSKISDIKFANILKDIAAVIGKAGKISRKAFEAAVAQWNAIRGRLAGMDKTMRDFIDARIAALKKSFEDSKQARSEKRAEREAEAARREATRQERERWTESQDAAEKAAKEQAKKDAKREGASREEAKRAEKEAAEKAREAARERAAEEWHEKSQDTLRARERRTNPERKEYDEVKRETDVFYVPDIHGDVVALKKSLRSMGLTDANNKWIGGRKVVQFSGDYVDRGTSSLEVMDYLSDISGQAERAGGRVDMLIGNHEAFMIGALLGEKTSQTLFFKYGAELRQEVAQRYGLDPSDYNGIVAKLRAECLEPKGRYYHLIRSWKPASQVDDVLYVHAGISPRWAKYIRENGVDAVNHFWNVALENAKHGDFDLFNSYNEMGRSRGGTADFGGLFWIDFEAEMETMSDREVRGIAQDLKAIGINALVVGHSRIKNPRMAENFARHGIKIVASDVSMSDAYREGAGSGSGGVRIDTAGNIDVEANGSTHKVHYANDKRESAKENVEFKVGKKVYIKRSSGDIEEWTIESLNSDGTYHVVSNDHFGRGIMRDVTNQELLTWREEALAQQKTVGGFFNGDGTFKSKDEILAMDVESIQSYDKLVGKVKISRKLFGLRESFDANELKAAHKRLRMQFHPDRNGSTPQANEMFKIIDMAKETLEKDLKKREAEGEGFQRAA